MGCNKQFPSWIPYFCSVMSDRIGHEVLSENVHSDELGWKGYIPSGGILTELPVLLCDEQGKIHALISALTYKHMTEGQITVDKFVNESFWHYGYYHGGSDIFNAIFWRPLEGNDAIGIINCRKVKRFFDKLVKKNVSQREIDRVCQYDYRKIYAEEIKKCIWNFFGFVVSEFFVHYYDAGLENTVLLKPSKNICAVDVYLSYQILIQLMYYPGLIDCVDLAHRAKFELCGTYNNKRQELPKLCADPFTFCTEFWKDLRWYESIRN